MRLVFSAGEASGDAYAAALATALAPSFSEISGIAGGAFASLGHRLIADSRRWGAIGILESLKVAPRVARESRALLREFERGEPGVFVPIDFGYLNIKMARRARSLGWRVVYFAPPGSWRRDKQGADLPSVTDAIVTQFDWSRDLLNQMGANAHWFGHPLVEMIGPVPEGERESIAILPGSRLHEVEYNLPVIAQAVAGLDRPLEFAVARSIDVNSLQRAWSELSGSRPAEFTVGQTYEVLKRARAAIICSGTATLEAAICRTPCVVMYRGSRWMEFEYNLRKPKFDFISLPNILLQRRAVPEFIQRDATPESVGSALRDLVADSPDRQLQLSDFAELATLLGPAEGIRKAADLIREYASL